MPEHTLDSRSEAAGAASNASPSAALPDAAAMKEAELVAMSEQLAQAYEELALLHRINGTLRLQRPAEEVLHQACADLVEGANLRYAVIRLDDDRRIGGLGGTFVAAAVGEEAAAGDAANAFRATALAAAKELMEDGPTEIPGSILEPVDATRLPNLASLSLSILAVPLFVNAKPHGWLFAGPREGASPLTSAEAKMAEAIAGPLCIFLENQLLFEETQALSTGVIASLVRALDAKDPYTRGHSERVGRTAAAIGRELGLPRERCERLELAGLVHDLGKIGVPEAILLKEGRLTDAEFARIQEHPERGVEILRGLGPLADLVPAVLHHHERWAGGGYPHGLVGRSIPLAARIVGLADAFDAIGSHRSYRTASPPGACLAEIQRCAGTHFDPEVVAALLAERGRAGEFPEENAVNKRHAA